jgi:hypothetical protein
VEERRRLRILVAVPALADGSGVDQVREQRFAAVRDLVGAEGTEEVDGGSHSMFLPSKWSQYSFLSA